MPEGEKQSKLESAAREASTGVFGEWFAYLRRSGKWWLLPIVITLLLLSGLMLLSGSPVAPFIYSLF